MTLASFNPLLHDVMNVRDGHRISLSFAPAGGALPCTGGTLHVAPLRLSLGDGPLLAQVGEWGAARAPAASHRQCAGVADEQLCPRALNTRSCPRNGILLHRSCHWR